jgi:disulfide bond formation protein DsbB
MNTPSPKPPCPSCVLIRRFLVGSVPILLLMLAGVELPALRGWLLTNIASFVIGAGLVLLVAWKAWNEYWRK